MDTFDAEAGAALRTRFEGMVADWEAVTTHTMFGHPSYKAGGTIFALLRTEGVVLTRLPAAERERVEAEFGAGPFETGRGTIDKWVYVPVGADDLDDLEFAVRASHGAALGESRTVPPPDES